MFNHTKESLIRYLNILQSRIYYDYTTIFDGNELIKCLEGADDFSKLDPDKLINHQTLLILRINPADTDLNTDDIYRKYRIKSALIDCIYRLKTAMNEKEITKFKDCIPTITLPLITDLNSQEKIKLEEFDNPIFIRILYGTQKGVIRINTQHVFSQRLFEDTIH